MKPRYRPGKPATSGSKARAAVSNVKPMSINQMQHLKEEKPVSRVASKAGKKGRRADWDIDYAEGVAFDMKPMPWREPESITIEGVRRFPKKGGK